MTIKQILDLLEPKNQNLPPLRAEGDLKKADIVCLPVIRGEEAALKKRFPELKNAELCGKKGESGQAVQGGRMFCWFGMGGRQDVTTRAARRFAGQCYLNSLSLKPSKIAVLYPGPHLGMAALGVHTAALDPALLRPDYKKKPVPEVMLLPLDKSAGDPQKALREALVMAEMKNMMRILGALPPNILNQPVYAELVMKLALKWKIPAKRASQKELKKYELLQAVSLGSEHPSELLVLRLDPAKKSKGAAALIGKGICYDSGGLIGKQEHMKCMKEDMAGSAAALAAALVIRKNGWRVKETTYFVLPVAQNMMGTRAMRADDVWRTGDGQTVEISHTDAEGRLVLADGICYVKNNFKEVNRFYTIATLTGSCVRALGDVYTGVVCNDEKLAARVKEAGEKTGDLMHAAPWDMEFDDYSSPVASVPNLTESPNAGWIKGGLFMHRFIPKTKSGEDAAEFCHLDIAGSIDMDEKGKPWRRKGLNSGVGLAPLVKLLAE